MFARKVPEKGPTAAMDVTRAEQRQREKIKSLSGRNMF